MIWPLAHTPGVDEAIGRFLAMVALAVACSFGCAGAEAQMAAPQEAAGSGSGADDFRDCEGCPVVVPPGGSRMGNADGSTLRRGAEGAKPQRRHSNYGPPNLSGGGRERVQRAVAGPPTVRLRTAHRLFNAHRSTTSVPRSIHFTSTTQTKERADG